MTSQYIYLVIFFCAVYLIVTDQSIAKAFVYVTQIATNKFLVFKWWFIHNPRLPWARYSMYRNSMKMAEELMKEFENKNL